MGSLVEAKCKTLIFLHIPKAAGSTLRELIIKQYRHEDVLSLSAPDEGTEEVIRQIPAERRRKLKVIQGHMAFGVHRLLDQQVTYITMLRDPIDRYISLYYYVLRSPDHDHYDAVISQNMSLADYVQSGLLEDNALTRRLAGLIQISKRRPGVVPQFECTRETLEMAKANLLKYFLVVGLKERFDESLILMRRELGWRIPFYEKRNVARERPREENISQRELDLIRRHTLLDAELHQFSGQILEEQISQSDHWFDKELAVFRLLNRCYRIASKSAKPIKHFIRSNLNV